MEEFHSLSTFFDDRAAIAQQWIDHLSPISEPLSSPIETRGQYIYRGRCPETGALVSLPRTLMAEAIAHELMRQLSNTPSLTTEGKMFGVLIVKSQDGQIGVLRAFSGLLNGQNVVPGWVPPIPGREKIVVEEERTVQRLEVIQTQLLELAALPERKEYDDWNELFTQRWNNMTDRHRQRKQKRQHHRQSLQSQLDKQQLLLAAYEKTVSALDDESRMDGIERRTLKRERDAILVPLRQKIYDGDRQMRELKQERKQLSRSLQAQMHEVYRLTNFRGSSSTLSSLGSMGTLPTGTGDCCAPKLLHYAATHQLHPISMAEFWWGPPPPGGNKVHGQFYGACTERCQPIMGFLLSGLATEIRRRTSDRDSFDISILYEDEWLIAVDKPHGMLSVPGRHASTQDSVVSRLRLIPPENVYLKAVHRLDRDTSGILLMAKTAEAHADLNQQFQRRAIKKVYGAVLAGRLSSDHGLIDVPLSADFKHRPKQRVNVEGKPSQTVFRVLSRGEQTTRVEFIPLTGRTHQLRVHASAPEGLGIAILGDRLYGSGVDSDRLHLHASQLTVTHPIHHQPLGFHSPVPFFHDHC